MNWWRVLYLDAAGEGRFEDVESSSASRAAWGIAIASDSHLMELVEVRAIDAPVTAIP